MPPEARVQDVQAMLSQNSQALAAVVEHGRGGQGNVQIIERMAPQIAIPALPSGARRSVGVAGIVALPPELLSITLGKLPTLVLGTETEGFLSFSLGHPPRAF